jgi:pyruvate/2-oxoglutarate dehydrogenase complex dihydrolipoamide acyltransferase (E2) component
VDVEKAQVSAVPGVSMAMPTGAQYTDIPLSSIRSVIAKRLTESKQVREKKDNRSE